MSNRDIMCQSDIMPFDINIVLITFFELVDSESIIGIYKIRLMGPERLTAAPE